MTATLHHDAPAVEPWALLATKLRERDHDPEYADAPVWDAYARLSFNPNTGDLEKTDRQLADALRAIEGRRARLGEIHRDDNLSAWKRTAKRPGWRRLMARIADRACSGVQAWHTDRLMRQPRDLEALIDAGDRGFLVASCFGEHDLANADDRFVLRIQTAAACKASDDTSRRQKRKAAAMREQGKGSGGPRSFGEPGTDRITREPVSAEQVKAERDAVAWGTEAHIDGVPLTSIVAEWNARGLLTVNGAPHTINTVRSILTRARNAGLQEHDRKLTGRRLVDVDPIVSVEQLEQVRALVAARRVGRPVAVDNMASGILRCGRCGYGLTSQATRGNYPDGAPRRKYQCKNPKGCRGVSIDQRRADGAVRDLTVARLSDPRHADRMAARSRAVSDLDAQIAEAEHTAREVGDRLGRGEITLDRHDAIMGPLDRRLADMGAKRKALMAEGTDGAAGPASLADVERLWGTDEGAEAVARRRALIRQAFPYGLDVAPVGPGGGRTFDPGRITPRTSRPV